MESLRAPGYRPAPFASSNSENPRTREWQQVRRDYESGAMAMKDVAARHGLSPSALANKARRSKWYRPERDVKKRSDRILINAALDARPDLTHAVGAALSYLRPGELAASAERISVLTRLHVDVLLAHRADIHELAHLTNGQLGELKAAQYSADRLFRSVDALLSLGVIDAEEAKGARRELRGICELKGRMVALRMLTAQYGDLQGLERQAFGIEAGATPIEDEATDVRGILVEFVDAPQAPASTAAKL